MEKFDGLLNTEDEEGKVSLCGKVYDRFKLRHEQNCDATQNDQENRSGAPGAESNAGGDGGEGAGGGRRAGPRAPPPGQRSDVDDSEDYFSEESLEEDEREQNGHAGSGESKGDDGTGGAEGGKAEDGDGNGKRRKLVDYDSDEGEEGDGVVVRGDEGAGGEGGDGGGETKGESEDSGEDCQSRPRALAVSSPGGIGSPGGAGGGVGGGVAGNKRSRCSVDEDDDDDGPPMPSVRKKTDDGTCLGRHAYTHTHTHTHTHVMLYNSRRCHTMLCC